jgi:chromate transporter
MWMKLWEIFVGFGRATLLGYGGGPSIIPLYEIEVVDRFHFMSKEDYGQALAFGNALPGPIATKLAAYIGFKVAGWAGAAVALTAVVLPTALLMVLLVGVMSKLSSNPIVQGMIKGIKPVIFVMLAMLAFDYVKFAFEPIDGVVKFLPFLIAAAFFVIVHYMGINAVWGIIGALIIGAIWMR